MKKLLLATAIAALSVSAAQAAPTIYGKAFVTMDYVNTDNGNEDAVKYIVSFGFIVIVFFTISSTYSILRPSSISALTTDSNRSCTPLRLILDS